MKGLIIGLVIAILLGAVISIDDAIHHRGYNYQTTKEYRQMVGEGKDTK